MNPDASCNAEALENKYDNQQVLFCIEGEINMADRLSVSCPNCGLGVELEAGVFGWKSIKCPKCKEKITYEKSRMKIMHCKNCNNDVVYDLERQNSCPICKRALVDNDEEHLSVVCPDCDIVVELEKGVFGWKKTACPKCGKMMRLKDQENQLVECPACKRTVVYNIRRRNNCPGCNGPLSAPAEQRQRRTIACPFCQVDVEYSAGDTNVVCPVCQGGFDPEKKAASDKASVADRDADIRMSEELAPDQLVWKHPRSGKIIPLSARIIAKPGMTAVVVQGDQQAVAVNGQSVMLSETGLKADAYQYGDNQDEKHVYVDIYYVRNAISHASFAWGGRASLVGSYNDVNEFALNGTCELAPIVDHAAFLRWVGFDTGVKAEAFTVQRDAHGVERAGEYAKAISKAMRSIYSEALRRVRDRKGILPAMLRTCTDEIVFEIQRLANDELRKWGVELQNVVLDELKELGTGTVYTDPLRARTEGRLEWQTGEITVHLKDNAMAMAQLRLNGSLYITVTDENRLKNSAAAARWRNGSENAAREELSRHVGDLLGSMFASIFQNLIEDMNPPLDMLSTYAGYLKAQAEQLINSPAELLVQHGLSAQQLTLNVRIVSKSSLYAANEQAQLTISESEIKEKLYEYEQDRLLDRKRKQTQRTIEEGKLNLEEDIAAVENRQKLDDAQTDELINRQNNQGRVASADEKQRHEQRMRGIAYAAEEQEANSRYSFEAWQEQARQEAAKEQEAIESFRRRAAFDHEMKRDQAMHDRAMHDIMRAVEESDQTWREKLDAYARLQRNLAAQDALDQQSAINRTATDDQVYDGYERLHLSEEARKIAAALDKDAKYLQEELDKAQFARDLELRRQTLAEDMQRLSAQYEQTNKQWQMSNEVTTLRLMLDYLAKQGEQQVTQATMQAYLANAKAEAERTMQEKREDERHKEQMAREDLMATRAHELTKEMMATQRSLAELEKKNQRAYEFGRAMVDAKGRQYQDEQISALVKQMEQMNAKLKDVKDSSATLTVGSELSKWLESLMKNGAAASASSDYSVFSAKATESGTRRCPYCQKQMRLSDVICPSCKRA